MSENRYLGGKFKEQGNAFPFHQQFFYSISPAFFSENLEVKGPMIS
jgi:hypothetical protein